MNLKIFFHHRFIVFLFSFFIFHNPLFSKEGTVLISDKLIDRYPQLGIVTRVDYQNEEVLKSWLECRCRYVLSGEEKSAKKKKQGISICEIRDKISSSQMNLFLLYHKSLGLSGLKKSLIPLIHSPTLSQFEQCDKKFHEKYVEKMLSFDEYKKNYLGALLHLASLFVRVDQDWPYFSLSSSNYSALKLYFESLKNQFEATSGV